MKFSIRIKLFALCILLVLLTAISSSFAYYVFIKQDKHRESQQRIEIAFDIILDDLAEQRQSYLTSVNEFLQCDRSLALTLMVYARQRTEQMSLQNTIVGRLNELGYVSSSDRLMLYGHELRKKTEEGVRHTEEGIKRSDQGVKLAYGVKDALTTIQEYATRSSQRAENTAQVIQQTADSSQVISASINQVTGMVSEIRTSLHTEEHDIEMVFEAVENISGMAAQVNRSTIEQKRAAIEVGRSMGEVTEQFSAISEQTGSLLRDSDQIVTAMHIVRSTAEEILRDANGISEETVQHLIQQSEILQKIVKSFKIS